MISDASIESYRNEICSGRHADKTLRVIGYVYEVKSCTARMIAQELDMDTSTVSGIVTPLVKSGEIRRSMVKSRCPVTGRNVYWLHPGC